VIETVPVGSISPDPANVRRHPERNLEAIKASLRRFGQQTPIVVDQHGIVRKGNGTLAAAVALGWTEIQIVRTSLTGSEATAYAIADNRTGELAEWDLPALSEQLDALIADGILLDDVGFLESELFEVPDFEPVGVDEQGRLDEKQKHTCPECGHEF
jgi:ParB-like chromosome segregation protein Spo0J